MQMQITDNGRSNRMLYVNYAQVSGPLPYDLGTLLGDGDRWCR